MTKRILICEPVTEEIISQVENTWPDSTVQSLGNGGVAKLVGSNMLNVYLCDDEEDPVEVAKNTCPEREIVLLTTEGVPGLLLWRENGEVVYVRNF